MALYKVIIEYKYSPKRDLNLTTPCCNKSNKDGKFTTYVDLPEIYGYCHSCGKTTLPPTIFKDEKGLEYTWNEIENKYESIAIPLQSICKGIAKKEQNFAKDIKYIPESTIWRYFHTIPENNLLQYLCKTYGKEKVEDAKETYVIGTNKDGGTVFWNINSDLKVQKAKITYYNENGKRTNHFKVPYKNEDGYYACLFGEHLIYDELKRRKTIILVESEKTAIVGYIHFPEYIWVAYCGINGLTENKLKPLIGHTVLIIPDMSESAVNVIYDKIPLLITMGINAKVWDMTKGKTDEQLKTEGIYNDDLEDVFRRFISE
ncbi:DUF6371 domain-containing protein [Flavobacterium maritimum]|uniref:DUF6371 domain-containing protein n=1 Tax=Flavobacterium maritimum TaxID=3149042 RepID=UPI0032B38ED0